MIITIRCIKKYGKCRAEFASAVLIAAESKFITTAGQCTSQYALSTLTIIMVTAGRNLRPLDSSLMSLLICSSTVTLIYSLLHLA